MREKIDSFHRSWCISSLTHCAVVSNTHISLNKFSIVFSSFIYYSKKFFFPLMAFIIHYTSTCLWMTTSIIYEYTHFSFFSPSLLYSCFGNHLMEILTFLQLGLFLLHAHSLLRLNLVRRTASSVVCLV